MSSCRRWRSAESWASSSRCIWASRSVRTWVSADSKEALIRRGLDLIEDVEEEREEERTCPEPPDVDATGMGTWGVGGTGAGAGAVMVDCEPFGSSTSVTEVFGSPDCVIIRGWATRTCETPSSKPCFRPCSRASRTLSCSRRWCSSFFRRSFSRIVVEFWSLACRRSAFAFTLHLC